MASIFATAAAAIALGNRRIEHRLRDRAGLHQLGLAVEIKSPEQRRLVVGKVRLLDQGVELNELGALLHVVAALEEIGRDLAAQLRGHVDALDGEQRADRMHPVGPALGLRLLGRDGCRRRRHLTDELGNHFRLEHEVEIADPAEEHGDDDGGNDEAFDHGFFVVVAPKTRNSLASRGCFLNLGRGQNCAPPAQENNGIAVSWLFANHLGATFEPLASINLA